MKKHFIYLFAIMFALVFVSCKDESTTPSNNNNNNNNNSNGNIPESEFSLTASGGDPRGVYTPNMPVLNVKLPAAPTGYSYVMEYTKNTGSGTLTLQGATATAGTYTKNNLVVDIEGSVKVKMGSTNLYTYPFPGDDDDDPFTEMPENGTWKVEGNKIFFNADTEGIDFSVTSKGMFAIMNEELKSGTNSFGTAIISFGMRKSTSANP